MKLSCAITLAAALSPVPMILSAAEPPQKIVAFNAGVRVDVDAAGKPVKVEAPQDLPLAVRNYIEKRVATWQYQPAKLDGTAVPATTYVKVGVCAIPVAAGSGFRLGLDYKGNGPRVANVHGIAPPPGYPADALRRGISGEFEVVVRVNADGTAEAMDISTAGGTGRGVLATFDPALRQWVKGLQYDPEIVAGVPVATRVQVPVSFKMGSRNSRSDIKREVMGRALASSECQMANATGVLERYPVALDSPVQVTPTPAG
ncbi:MAG: energy transducer TonB [Pseudomonadota bacterium]|nr:energy transducer TonB [Pseudomonadota bacterium]